MNPDIGIISGVAHIGDKKKNEVPEVQFLRIGTPKNLQGLSPLSSACLYLNTASSTPWDKLANSRDSTFDSRYSINSGGSAIVSDFLRIVLDMHAKPLRVIINTCMQIALTSCNMHDGVPENETNQPTSASYGRPTETYNQPYDFDGMSRKHIDTGYDESLPGGLSSHIGQTEKGTGIPLGLFHTSDLGTHRSPFGGVMA